LTVPCELEHCHGGESNHWTKVQASFYVRLHVTDSIFTHNRLDWLTMLNGFKVNNASDIEESDERHLCFVFDMRVLFEPFMLLKNTRHFHASESTAQV
jgi:hypothetical protein